MRCKVARLRRGIEQTIEGDMRPPEAAGDLVQDLAANAGDDEGSAGRGEPGRDHKRRRIGDRLDLSLGEPMRERCPGIVAGMILAFAKAMGEFGATITFVSNIPGETQTLPSAIYTFTQVPGGEPGALRLTLVSIAIAMLALVGSEVLARRIGSRIDPA